MIRVIEEETAFSSQLGKVYYLRTELGKGYYLRTDDTICTGKRFQVPLDETSIHRRQRGHRESEDLAIASDSAILPTWTPSPALADS